jgi:hypothetical protein
MLTIVCASSLFLAEILTFPIADFARCLLRKRTFRHLVQEHAVPTPLQSVGNALGLLLGPKRANAQPVKLSYRPISCDDIGM